MGWRLTTARDPPLLWTRRGRSAAGETEQEEPRTIQSFTSLAAAVAVLTTSWLRLSPIVIAYIVMADIVMAFKAVA